MTPALQTWALAQRVERQIQGEIVRFAPLEYVILYKLRYTQMGGSDRHLRGIARMIEVNESDIDHSVLDGWIAQFGLAEQWARAQSMVGHE